MNTLCNTLTSKLVLFLLMGASFCNGANFSSQPGGDEKLIGLNGTESAWNFQGPGISIPSDSVPPILIFTSPVANATGVAINSPVTFTFSEAMAASQSITWSANVDASKFAYSWSADQKTLTATYNGPFPANAIITWNLDPAAFKAADGDSLFPFNTSGQFTTSSGSNPDPCHESTNTLANFFSLYKTIGYLQTNALPPIIDPDFGAAATANAYSSTTNPITAATVQLPNGSTLSLSNFVFLPQNFFFFQQFASEAQLDAFVPSGNYTLNFQHQNGSAETASVTVGQTSLVPTPQIANLPQAQSITPGTDFTFQWNAFAGAAEHDGIYFEIHDASGVVFSAPDPCVPRTLANTATSITVPGNLLTAGKVYDGTLSFTKITGMSTNAASGLFGSAGISKQTAFKLMTQGAMPEIQPRFTGITPGQNGTLIINLAGQAGTLYQIEATSDLKTWSPLLTTNAPSDTITFTNTVSAAPYRFYRAIAEPLGVADGGLRR